MQGVPEKVDRSGMVLLLTAHQLPFQSTDETTATAANAKADTQ